MDPDMAFENMNKRFSKIPKVVFPQKSFMCTSSEDGLDWKISKKNIHCICWNNKKEKKTKNLNQYFLILQSFWIAFQWTNRHFTQFEHQTSWGLIVPSHTKNLGLDKVFLCWLCDCVWVCGHKENTKTGVWASFPSHKQFTGLPHEIL